MRLRILAAAAMGLAVGGTAAQAATVIYAGSLIDLGGGWRTPAVPKSGFDTQQAGVLGAAGWFVAGGSGSSAQPSFVTSMTPNGSVYGGNGAYAIIDDPTTTPGASPTEIYSGVLNPFPGPGQTTDVFDFTTGASTPFTIQVGVMVDNTDGNQYTPSALQITDSAGPGSATVTFTTPQQDNSVPDWYFFDIVGATSGESFSIVGTGGGAGCACVGAVSFDTAVPEPETWTMMILGAGAVGGAMRLQRRSRLELQARS